MNIIIDIITFNRSEADVKCLRNLIRWFFISKDIELWNLDILMKLNDSLKVLTKWWQACLKKIIKCVIKNNILTADLCIWIWSNMFIRYSFKCLYYAREKTLLSEKIIIILISEKYSEILLIVCCLNIQNICLLITFLILVLHVLLLITSIKLRLSLFETADVWSLSSHDVRHSVTCSKSLMFIEKR